MLRSVAQQLRIMCCKLQIEFYVLNGDVKQQDAVASRGSISIVSYVDCQQKCLMQATVQDCRCGRMRRSCW